MINDIYLIFRILNINHILFCCFLIQTTESITTETVSSSPAGTTTAMTATSAAVGHFYRQFSKKNKNGNSSKKKQRQDVPPVEVAAAAPTPSFAVVAPVAAAPEAGSCTAAAFEHQLSDQPAAVTGNPRLRPALAAQMVDGPLWLVADHFVSEHVAHEHVSVVPEPDHADPVPMALDDYAATPSQPPDSSTTVCKCPAAAASSCAHVSCARNSSTLLHVMLY